MSIWNSGRAIRPGLRISEAAALPVTAIDKTSGVLRVVGKGNKERVVPVPKEVHEGLRRMWQATTAIRAGSSPMAVEPVPSPPMS